jgi:hypothetical protein
VVVQQHCRRLLKMGILMPEICWVSKKKNKNIKWHLVGFFFFFLSQDGRSNKHQSDGTVLTEEVSERWKVMLQWIIWSERFWNCCVCLCIALFLYASGTYLGNYINASTVNRTFDNQPWHTSTPWRRHLYEVSVDLSHLRRTFYVPRCWHVHTINVLIKNCR